MKSMVFVSVRPVGVAVSPVITVTSLENVLTSTSVFSRTPATGERLVKTLMEVC